MDEVQALQEFIDCRTHGASWNIVRRDAKPGEKGSVRVLRDGSDLQESQLC